jgi:UDP-GlcNAc:undecaprenyl-phosphate GlcNAc-1-phosphate transferase
MTNIIFFVCYFATIFFFVSYYKRISEILKLTDKPSTKKIHKKQTPLMGGVIIFFLLIEIFTFHYYIYLKNIDILILITISFFCFFIGLVDDRINIRSYIKLLIILFVLLFLLNFSNSLVLQILYFKSLNKILNLGVYGIYFTTLCILLLINAYNLSDGINGLAVLISIHWILSLFFFTFNVSIYHLLLPFLTLIIVGLFIYNEKFFLGDSGSLLISSLIGLLTIYLYNSKLKIDYTTIPAEKIFLIFIIPGLDMFRLFIERILNKKDPLSGDTKHLHHLLIKKYKLNKTLIIYSLILTFPFYADYFYNDKEIYITLFTIVLYFYIIYFLKKIYKS